MRWGNMWQCEAQLLYEVNRRALGTRDVVTLFFTVCIITDRETSETTAPAVLKWMNNE